MLYSEGFGGRCKIACRSIQSRKDVNDDRIAYMMKESQTLRALCRVSYSGVGANVG
jgi:hypothetical protein